MRRDEEKRDAALRERNNSRIRLEVLCRGIGGQFEESGSEPWEMTNANEPVRLVNTELVPAIARVEAAEKAYEPYWLRRRRRVWRPAKKKTPKTANAKSKAKKRRAGGKQ